MNSETERARERERDHGEECTVRGSQQSATTLPPVCCSGVCSFCHDREATHANERNTEIGVERFHRKRVDTMRPSPLPLVLRTGPALAPQPPCSPPPRLLPPGTGKTGAYLIPTLEQVDTTKNYIQALILVPTRELALQTAAICKELGKHLNVQVMTSTGGTRVQDEIMRLYETGEKRGNSGGEGGRGWRRGTRKKGAQRGRSPVCRAHGHHFSTPPLPRPHSAHCGRDARPYS